MTMVRDSELSGQMQNTAQNSFNLPAPGLILGCGLEDAFPAWYPGQQETFKVILTWLQGEERFLGLSLPTGSGKSVLAVLAAVVTSRRAVILTATKGLQAQLMRDFASAGMVDMRGQGNFRCPLPEADGVSVDQAPCHEGLKCDRVGCTYYERLAEAKASNLVVTNYAYYLAQTQHGEGGLGDVDLLVCDECHQLFAAVESYVSQHIGRDEVRQVGGVVPQAGFTDWSAWQQWAKQTTRTAGVEAATRKAEIAGFRLLNQKVPSALRRAYRLATSVERRCKVLGDAAGAWVWQSDGAGWKFTPVWPKEYMQGALYGQTGKVMVMSAELTSKLASTIDMPGGIVSQPSYFPARNTPVQHVQTIRLNHRATAADMQLWVSRIDQIIDRRLDRKGLIFTASYDRRNLLLSRSRHSAIMMAHGTDDVTQMVEAFKLSDAPRVMVSPAITSGWNFSDDLCRYIIIGKVPYPDTRDPVLLRRQEDDPDWGAYLAMGLILQVSGRGSRSRDDWTEVLIVDDSWKWFWPKYKQFAPGWFWQRVLRSVDLVPDAMRAPSATVRGGVQRA